MSKYDRERVRFDTGAKKKKSLSKKSRKKDDDALLELRKIINRNSDTGIEFTDIDEVNFQNLKVLSKKKGIKAIMSGKVLNADRKKYRKWRKHDKDIIKDMISPSLQEMYEDGNIGYKKAKKLRKVITNRIISCFYGIDD